MSICAEETKIEVDKIRHDFKGKLRTAKIIFDYLDKEIKSGVKPNEMYIQELVKTVGVLKSNCDQLKEIFI